MLDDQKRRKAIISLPSRRKHFLRLRPWTIQETGGTKTDDIAKRVHSCKRNWIPKE
jgi:hypothetical protein